MTSLPWKEVEPEFIARTHRIVFCTFATVDTSGKPRTRILHPLWEGTTGWISTGRHSLKERHLAANPYVALSYWDPQEQNVHVEAKAEWEEDPAEKRRIWALFGSTPEPVGYNLGDHVPGGPDSDWGLLKLTPWRIELSGMTDVAAGLPFRRVWRA